MRESSPKFTRRAILRSAGAAISVAALPNSSALAADSGSVMATLAGYMSEAHQRALPDPVTQGAKHHILDTFAAMISGSQLPPGLQAIKFARAMSGQKVATVAASQVLCGTIDAAFANGELAHSD